MNTQFAHLLLGKDRRTVRQNSAVVTAVNDQKSFDELFNLTLHHERPLAMRAVDAVEKITLKQPQFLAPHKAQLLSILKSADHKELKWHIAQLITRVKLTSEEQLDVWHILTYWALNRNESKIVRVNALQGLFDLSRINPFLTDQFEKTLQALDHEMIPSIQARVRKLKKTNQKIV